MLLPLPFSSALVAGLVWFGATCLPAAPSTPAAASPSPMRLWAGDAPGSLGQAEDDIPTLTAYLPAPGQRNGATMVVYPGGGYSHLSVAEGKGYAEWLASHGVVAYVLKYRLGSKGYRHPAMLNDAARSVRMARAFARRDGLDPARIGVIGSSAGGHLASTIATHFDAGDPQAADPVDRESSRPDLVVLCYPVISLGAEFGHSGSRRNLLGDKPSPEQIRRLSNDLQVTQDTPPTFLWHTGEDNGVVVENSLLFAAALRRAGVPFSLHVYEKGGHGLGLGRPDRPAPPWGSQLLYWFKERKFTP